MLSGRAYLLGGKPLFFPFVSGIFSYECATCDAPCCKGASLGIGRSFELVTIQSAQPRAPLFAVPTFFSSGMLALHTPAESCWFLDRKRRCRLERVLGREAKPAGCRMFPFVRVRAAGEHLIVLPDFSCPLRIGEINVDGVTGHDALTRDMVETQMPRSGHPTLVPPRDMRWPEAIVLERRVVEESHRFLDAARFLPFAELQHVLALSALGVDERAGRLARIEDNARRFLGVTEPLSKERVRELVGLCGVLRIMASGLARRDVAPVLVALSVLLSAAENMRGAHITARTAPSIMEARLPLLFLIAHLESRPMIRSSASLKRAVEGLPGPRPSLAPVLSMIRKNGRRNVAATLEDILRAQGPSFSSPLSADAVATLQSLGTILLRAGTFVPA